jgi:hypothetical protein
MMVYFIASTTKYNRNQQSERGGPNNHSIYNNTTEISNQRGEALTIIASTTIQQKSAIREGRP